MIESTEATYLECTCGGEQLHLLTYVHGCLLTIICDNCKKTTMMPRELVIGQYTRDFRGRLNRLPAKLRSDAQDHPVRFVVGLPVKTINKVAQVLHEIKLIART
ncbi:MULTISPECIES: hypothetical protein [Streptomyces]|uniref:hypothetical protein n=1 Tax=Streptomyces TaxID=1883 RepID=UPI0029BBDF4C|nr:hypothetical protein [Streptomyces sp. MB09-02B]MDX3638072.1 hypothetical protein [Streptomyces sp. MB09-02B]